MSEIKIDPVFKTALGALELLTLAEGGIEMPEGMGEGFQANQGDNIAAATKYPDGTVVFAANIDGHTIRGT